MYALRGTWTLVLTVTVGASTNRLQVHADCDVRVANTPAHQDTPPTPSTVICAVTGSEAHGLR